MRLIDADKLIYEDIECTDGNTYMVIHAPQIDVAPTAYDVDKVVEQLEVKKFLSNYEQEQFVYDKAIEIVKAGGANDD